MTFLLSGTEAQARPYTFQLIAGGPSGGHAVPYSLLDDGSLSWSQIDGGSNTTVLRRIGNTTQTIASASLPDTVSVARMNSNHELVYLAKTGNVQRIIRNDGTTNVPVIDSAGEFAEFGSPSINDAGDVIAWARRDNNTNGVFVFRNGTAVPIMTSGNGISGFQSEVFTNRAGRSVFQVGRSDQVLELRTGDENGTTLIDTMPSSFSSFGGLSINEAGHVLTSQFGASTRSLVLYRDGTATTLVTELGPYRDFGNVSLNDHDDVAFYADVRNTTTSGIYFGPDPVTQRLIQSGDTLFGSTVSRIQGFTEGCMNNAGQILFSAQLQGGGLSVLVLATPTPEPGVASVGIFALISLRRRSPCRPILKR